MSSMSQKVVTAALVVALGATVGCGSERDTSVSVDLFGWIANGSGQFTEGMPQYDGADELAIQVTDPNQGELIDEQTISVDQRRARMPEVPGGGTRRLDFEVRDNTGEPIATGATPSFRVFGNGRYHGFRAMLAPVDQFAPVASRQRNPDTNEFEFAPTTFDIREYYDEADGWSGRMGHTAAVGDSGEVVAVGGARLGVDYQPGAVPSLNRVLGDIQVFDTETGYFTELGAYDDAQDAGATGEDRLADERVFHTVTHVGGDRFVVVGGFQDSGGQTTAVDSVELIDLGASPGERVEQLGSLQQARGFHTATYRESDGTVVVAGGLGGSDDDIIDTIEIIDPDSGSISGGISMQSPRAAHSAVLLEDDDTVWLLGGKSSSDTVEASTEIVMGEATDSAPAMEQPRHSAAAKSLGETGNDLVIVVGGFTDSGVSSRFEIGNPLGGGGFESAFGGDLTTARGAPHAVMLPQSDDLVVLGGYDADMDLVGSAQRIRLPMLETEPEMANMVHLRGEPAVAVADNGRIIVSGGDAPGDVERNDAEYLNAYDPVQ